MPSVCVPTGRWDLHRNAPWDSFTQPFRCVLVAQDIGVICGRRRCYAGGDDGPHYSANGCGSGLCADHTRSRSDPQFRKPRGVAKFGQCRPGATHASGQGRSRATGYRRGRTGAGRSAVPHAGLECQSSFTRRLAHPGQKAGRCLAAGLSESSGDAGRHDGADGDRRRERLHFHAKIGDYALELAICDEKESSNINEEDIGIAARRRLAKRIFEAEEFLDPSNTETWESLSEGERSYYDALIGELLFEKTDLCIALKIS